jgi:carbon storage regulator
VLVLTRRKEQVLRIGPQITVTVLGISEGRVRLGVEAPEDVTIVRGELEEEEDPCEEYPTVCPRCGGRFVATVFDVLPVCPHCGHTFSEDEAASA